MKKEYESPALELIDVELIDMLATSDTIEISEDETTNVDSRQLLIFSLTDD